ncbi:hypothetical protein VE04_08947 [Pseudogymnoascus sp. 24MN13]|nr:hypothetical protein VE04_08947 [Pseudogymnoascus sp. 24MN13]
MGRQFLGADHKKEKNRENARKHREKKKAEAAKAAEQQQEEEGDDLDGLLGNLSINDNTDVAITETIIAETIQGGNNGNDKLHNGVAIAETHGERAENTHVLDTAVNSANDTTTYLSDDGDSEYVLHQGDNEDTDDETAHFEDSTYLPLDGDKSEIQGDDETNLLEDATYIDDWGTLTHGAGEGTEAEHQSVIEESSDNEEGNHGNYSDTSQAHVEADDTSDDEERDQGLHSDTSQTQLETLNNSYTPIQDLAYLDSDQGETRTQSRPVAVPYQDAEVTPLALLESVALLKTAWDACCGCDEPQVARDNRAATLTDMTEEWQRLTSKAGGTGNDTPNFPLDVPDLKFTKSRDASRVGVHWERLLAGTSETKQISFKTEEELYNTDGVEIRRDWDIDSFIGLASSLDVHRGGFRLSYSPSFLRKSDQNQRVLINGYKIHTIKQLELGEGLASGGYGYTTHVCFPQMGLGKDKDIHLSLAAQKVWYERIVIPAIRLACPPSVIQHHPTSFADIRARAGVKQETTFSGYKQAIDLRYCIPERHTSDFWKHVTDISNGANTGWGEWVGRFRGLFIVVSGHNLKLFSKQESLVSIAEYYRRHLDLSFVVERFHSFPDCWVDIGMEDVPAGTEPITLLRKTHCLRQWARQFTCTEKKADRTAAETYRWLGCQDAGSASVELLDGNTKRKLGQIAYNKAYNSNKEMMATPLKGYTAFGNQQFEALAYSQEVIETWHRHTNPRSTMPLTDKRDKLLEMYLVSKNRVSTAIRDSRELSFGVRQEYRISLELMTALGLKSETNDTADDETITLVVAGGSEMNCVNLDRSRRSASAASADNEQSVTGVKLPRAVEPRTGLGPRPTTEPQMARAGRTTRSGRSIGIAVASNSVAQDASSLTTGGEVVALTISEDERRGVHTVMGRRGQTHRPYWVLRTSVVNAFMAAQTNRWLLLVEVLIAQVEKTMNGAPSISMQQQLTNGAMAATILRLVKYGFSGNGSDMRAVLAKKWKVSAKYARQNAEVMAASRVHNNVRASRGDGSSVNSSSNTDEETPLSSDVGDLERRTPAVQWQHGLGVEDVIREYGVVWLPGDQVLWSGAYPMFSPTAMSEQAVAKGNFIQSHFAITGAGAAIAAEDQRLRQLVQEAGSWETRGVAMGACALMVVQEYVKCVIDILASRWDGGTTGRHTQTRTREFVAFAKLSKDEAAGLHGINRHMVQRMVGLKPRLVTWRSNKGGSYARNGRSRFAKYNTGVWEDKVWALFAWEDESDADKQRGWDGQSFRQAGRQIYHAMEQEWGEDMGGLFLETLKNTAADKLSWILQYDLTHLSCQYKPTSHNSVARQEAIHSMSALQKTNWVIAQVDEPYQGVIKEYERKVWKWTGVPYSPDDSMIARLKTALLPSNLVVYGYVNSTDNFPLGLKVGGVLDDGDDDQIILRATRRQAII